MTDIDQLFGNLRRPVFVEDPNAVPQDRGAGNGNVGATGWLEDNSVSSDVIQASAVIASKISAGAVETEKLAANAVTADKIAANTITAAQIAAGSITGNEIAANTITGANIAANTITAADIAANTITANEIAANSITANEIAANAITASEIAADVVTTNKILAGNVTSSRMEVDISGKTFGANSGSAGAPGYYFGSGSNYGLYFVSSFPLLGAILGMSTNSNLNFLFSTIQNKSTPKLTPGTDNSVGLGDASFRWTEVWAVDGTINTSDRNIKQDIADDPLGLSFIQRLRPRVYRWRDTADTQAVERAESGFDASALAAECGPWEQKMVDAQARLASLRSDHPDEPRLKYVVAQCQQKLSEIRTRHEAPILAAREARRPGRRFHHGLIAQEVKEALDAEGVDAAFWKQSPDGLQSLSYSELIAPLILAVQQLAQRVEELEGRS